MCGVKHSGVSDMYKPAIKPADCFLDSSEVYTFKHTQFSLISHRQGVGRAGVKTGEPGRRGETGVTRGRSSSRWRIRSVEACFQKSPPTRRSRFSSNKLEESVLMTGLLSL